MNDSGDGVLGLGGDPIPGPTLIAQIVATAELEVIPGKPAAAGSDEDGEDE